MISEFQAARAYKKSPILLRWFTKNDPKNDGVKLMYEEKSGILYFENEDLAKFDLHLREPWPKPSKGTRPLVPNGIKDEIKKEAYHRCPVCKEVTGEIAHIKPVAKTYCNHPHNLIFLCANHHTEYDYGHKYKGISESDVLKFKDALQLFQSLQWGLQENAINSYLGLITVIGRLKELESVLVNFTGTEFDKMFKEIIKKIEHIKLEKSEPEKVEQIMSSVHLNNTDPPKDKAYAFLTVEKQISDELSINPNKKQCPLCEGHGTVEGDLCPVCDGEKYIQKTRNVNLSLYKQVNCPLCSGAGHTNYFEECPVCIGYGKISAPIAENVDLTAYELVDCVLCEGSGHADGLDECPVCNGDKKITKGAAEQVDLTRFEFVKCPLCKGRGRYEGYEECPVCDGDKKVTRETADEVDLAKYELVDCPACNGTGRPHLGDDCPVCEGDKKIPRERSENVDPRSFGLVECPLCKGTGRSEIFDDCPVCEGERTLTRKAADRVDLSDYKVVNCPICKGKGHARNHDDCPGCSGGGKMYKCDADRL